MMKILKLLTVLSFVAILGGCAVGVTHEYQNAAPELKASAGAKLGLGVQDKRIYVVSKKKPETFVGLTRGGFNNPFDVNTVSGKPLADDFTQTIQAALSDKGVKVNAVSLPVGIDENDAIKRLSAAGDKAIFIVLNEWKSDTFVETTLAYDVQAKVVDARGKVLASKKISGKDNLGSSGMNAPGHSRSAVPVAFRKKLEELFAAPEISEHM
jgi:ABC-type glycerol-3-phosphate transport system substrate-binding protein